MFSIDNFTNSLIVSQMLDFNRLLDSFYLVNAQKIVNLTNLKLSIQYAQ